jgi:serine/threonine protein kinase
MVQPPAAPLATEGVEAVCTCGTVPVMAALPYRLGEFCVRRRLGAGGMGVVYLARDVRLDRDVALKTLPTIGAEAIAGLSREAKAMAALNHDALATIYGLEIWRDVPVLVFEYFPLGTLARRLAADGPLAVEAAVDVGVALARALGCMHERGLLHGDVKPANVGFTSSNQAKLLDFGLSRMTARDPYDLRAVHAGGTLAYLSPEVLGGETWGRALAGHEPAISSDLWALAVLLLESLTGRNPFVRATRAATRDAILTADAIELCKPVESSSLEFARLLRRALGPPHQRFVTAAAMHAALKSVRARSNVDQRE